MFCRRNLVISSVLPLLLAFPAHAQESDFVTSRGGSLHAMGSASAPEPARDELAGYAPQDASAAVSEPAKPAKPHVHPQPQVPAGWSSLSDPSIGAGGLDALGNAGDESGYAGNAEDGRPVPQIPLGYTQVGGYGDASGIQGMPTTSMGYAMRGMAASGADGTATNAAADSANYGAFVSSLMRYINSQPNQGIAQVGLSGRYGNTSIGFAPTNAMGVNCGAGMTVISTPAGVVCR